MKRFRATTGNGFGLAAARRCSIVLMLLATVAVWCTAAGQPDGVMNAKQGIAIDGYDTVAYFTLGEAVRGTPQFSAEWEGVVWLFRSAAHRDHFANAPERFAPQYGGNCAQAVTNDRIVRADPTVWSIVDGRLFLNCGIRIQRRFRRDVDENVKAADGAWLRLHERIH